MFEEKEPLQEAEAIASEEDTGERQGKLVQRSYHTPIGIVVDFGIQIGDTVYEPRGSAVSPLGVSEAKKGWREVSESEKETYPQWEKKKGAFGNRARKIADIEQRWDEIITKGKTSQEHGEEQLASYESYIKRRDEANRQFSLKLSDLAVGMTLENVATGNRETITEITNEGWVYARPENEPTESGGSIGKGEVKGYRLAVQKVATPEVEIEVGGAVMSRWLTPTQFANLVITAVVSGMSLGEAIQTIREEAEEVGVPEEVIDEGVEIAEEHFEGEEVE